MKEQINEQLALLEKELSRLKKVTDYIDDTKKTAQVVISELKEVQDNYSTYTEKIFDLYKTSVEQLKKETELQIKEGVINFETTGSQIDQTNREKLVETKRLLENYRKTVEATNGLVKTLEAVDFPTRLDTIDKKISKNLEEIKQRFSLQDKQNKVIKILLFVILGLIGIGGLGALLIWMKII
ncbi:hypothetical protein [Ancylomarina longa]|uniref:Uncharacterized protein n=1 Tax=Ancylomarina longa TaxID=2487017 RepID=A0A434AG10_9BACT|nr:hypothetical protein [Ancylomarina longa]RUT73292.1 hypothetical protein DLK05_14055 [Ancylomarina longa]